MLNKSVSGVLVLLRFVEVLEYLERSGRPVGKNILQTSSESDLMVPEYDPKNKKVHEFGKENHKYSVQYYPA